MIKAFISHSSTQKSFVEKLVETLGRTLCIIDEYDFEPAKKSKDEIFRKIRNADIFILLISKSALTSQWVQLEVGKARDRMEKGKLEFFPYIIDSAVKFTDDNIPTWITKDECINLKTFINVRLLSRDILQKQKAIIYQKRPEIKIRDELFVGRNGEIEYLENKLYSSSNYNDIKAIIVSGRKNIGRRQFLKNFIHTKLGYTNNPFDISLSRGDSIENFILQLNYFLLIYDFNDFSWDLWDKNKKVSVAVELLNRAYATKQFIFIVDNGACISPNGNIADWLIDILTNPLLYNFIGLFITSIQTPKSYLVRNRKDCLFVELHPLSESDRRTLFYAYARNIGLQDIDKDDVIFWTAQLHNSPEQIFMAIDTINRDGRMLARKNAEHIIAFGDKSIKEIVDYCQTIEYNDIKLLDIMILLTEVGSVSDHMLLKIVGEDYRECCYKIIDDLHYWSLVEFFGPSREYIQLDAGIADYIDRAGYKLLPRFSERLEQRTKEYLSAPETPSFETADLSDYLYGIQVAIKNGQYDSKCLIPSVVIKSIIELYNKEKYDAVIELCEGFLKESNRIYRDARREINYWYCLSLARQKNRHKFDVAVEEMSGLDKLFLKGFMCRLLGDLRTAKDLFTKILSQNASYTKAARELVTVLLIQKDYQEALSLAKDNYDKNKVNPYHIEAYFRCLIHKNNLNYDECKTLRELIAAMKTSYNDNHDLIAQTMEAEYQYYVNRNIELALSKLHDLARIDRPLRYTQRALYELQMKAGIPPTYPDPDVE